MLNSEFYTWIFCYTEAVLSKWSDFFFIITFKVRSLKTETKNRFVVRLSWAFPPKASNCSSDYGIIIVHMPVYYNGCNLSKHSKMQHGNEFIIWEKILFFCGALGFVVYTEAFPSELFIKGPVY